MWDCIKCGCKLIAASLGFCPMCGEDKEMPKIAAGAAPSNANAAEGEPGYIAPEKPAPNAASAAKAAAKADVEVSGDAETQTLTKSAKIGK